MLEINSLKVKNCRGISKFEFTKSIESNKPNIIIAPNGFGKTSLTHLFMSISGHNCIKLNKDDRYNMDEKK